MMISSESCVHGSLTESLLGRGLRGVGGRVTYRFLDSIQKYLQFESFNTCNSETPKPTQDIRFQYRYTCYLYVRNHKYCHFVYVSSIFSMDNVYIYTRWCFGKVTLRCHPFVRVYDDHDDHDDDEITAYTRILVWFSTFSTMNSLCIFCFLFAILWYDVMLVGIKLELFSPLEWQSHHGWI